MLCFTASIPHASPIGPAPIISTSNFVLISENNFLNYSLLLQSYFNQLRTSKRVMVTFKYSFIAKLIYRYANIPATILLIPQTIYSFAAMFEVWYFVFPFTVDLLILFFMNRFFFRSYKTFPFKIEADNEKIICSDFLIGSDITIKHSEITDIKGGFFSGNTARPIYIFCKDRSIKIGIHGHLKGVNKLLTTILSNINQELYNELLAKTKELGDKQIGKMKGKKKKARR